MKHLFRQYILSFKFFGPFNLRKSHFIHPHIVLERVWEIGLKRLWLLAYILSSHDPISLVHSR